MPTGEEGNQASLFFLPFFTLQGLWVSSRTGPPEGQVLGEPKWLLYFYQWSLYSSPGGRGQELQSDQELAAAFPILWLHDSWGPTLMKQALSGRCLRALGLCGEVFRPGSLGAGESKGPAEQLLSPSTLSR